MNDDHEEKPKRPREGYMKKAIHSNNGCRKTRTTSRPDEQWIRTLYRAEYRSPLGPYILISSHRGVVILKNKERAQFFMDRWERQNISVQHDDTRHAEIKEQLDDYFSGKHLRFSISLDLHGTTTRKR